jgi:hypothetical protein
MRCFIRCLCLALLAFSSSAWSQGFDPRVPLGELIQAFQNCGPPAAFQMLSPQLFELIAQQTGGRGCYPEIQAAGPIQGMEVIDQKMYPVGPVYVIRVTHSAGSVDWFIGFNQSTGRVELLTFQPATSSQPTVEDGPQDDHKGGNPTTPSEGGSQGGSKSSQSGCELYPAMC